MVDPSASSSSVPEQGDGDRFDLALGRALNRSMFDTDFAALRDLRSELPKWATSLREARERSKACEDFRPTPECINALPEALRQYIHDLETQSDPAGMVRENVLARETIAATEILLREAREQRDSAIRVRDQKWQEAKEAKAARSHALASLAQVRTRLAYALEYHGTAPMIREAASEVLALLDRSSSGDTPTTDGKPK